MSEHEVPSFDLIDQPWLLVRRRDGTVTELSLIDTFDQAHDLAGLVGDVPTQVFALTRLLLAILHGAVDGPRDVDHWAELWESDRLPIDDIRTYLERHRSRFDLLHQETPFFQVAGLHTEKGEMAELSKLIADIPNGHPFFSTRLDRDLSLSFAEAARWIVHCHAFDPSGIKSGAADDDRVKGGKGYPIGVGWSGLLGGVVPEGATVRETLLLNLIARDYEPLARWAATDLPAWEREPPGAGERPTSHAAGGEPHATGFVDLYTWQSRRIRLAHDGHRVTAVLICNGDRLTPQNHHIVEPHTAWRRSAPQELKLKQRLVYMPREHNPERAIWRGLQSLLPGAEKPQKGDAAQALSPTVLEWISHVGDVVGPDFPLRMRTIGMTYGSQSSTTEEIIDDALSLRAVLVRHDAADLAGVVVSCVEAAEKAARALGSLAANLAAAAGGESDGPRSRATELAFAELDISFRTWISGLQSDTDATVAQVVWHSEARRVVAALGRDLVARASATAWIGRTVKGRLVTSAHADSWFRKDLHDVLPLAGLDLAATS
jgi:CRISPR system Cascade subunit CasA